VRIPSLPLVVLTSLLAASAMNPPSLHALTREIIAISDLIENASSLDGKEVFIEGEAIGGLLPRGGMAWLNLEDSSGAIGLWLSADIARSIHQYGSYKAKGDIVEIHGTFHRACMEHGGDTDIHVASLAVLVKGYPVRHDIPLDRALAAIAIGIASLILGVMLRRRDSRMRALSRAGSSEPGLDGK
jgi:hypothetical protein